MRDLGVLKERIEYAERHLTASHTARERESEALMAMWRQIRDRFELQEQEIARYRTQLAEMTGVNDELSALVDRLIASVEGGVDVSANETVPEIARLADDLLKSEPAAFAAPDTEDPLELSADMEAPDEEPRSRFDDEFDADFTADHDRFESDLEPPEPVTEDSASEGIRDLITRIEGSVSGTAGKAEMTPVADGEDEDLARELGEIEALRNELNGLRNKITAGG